MSFLSPPRCQSLLDNIDNEKVRLLSHRCIFFFAQIIRLLRFCTFCTHTLSNC